MQEVKSPQQEAYSFNFLTPRRGGLKIHLVEMLLNNFSIKGSSPPGRGEWR